MYVIDLRIMALCAGLLTLSVPARVLAVEAKAEPGDLLDVERAQVVGAVGRSALHKLFRGHYALTASWSAGAVAIKFWRGSRRVARLRLDAEKGTVELSDDSARGAIERLFQRLLETHDLSLLGVFGADRRPVGGLALVFSPSSRVPAPGLRLADASLKLDPAEDGWVPAALFATFVGVGRTPVASVNYTLGQERGPHEVRIRKKTWIVRGALRDASSWRRVRPGRHNTGRSS